MDSSRRVEMLDAPCDRCGKVAPALHPFKLSEVIHFRGKKISHPWLCRPCFIKEKEKWWKSQAILGATMPEHPIEGGKVFCPVKRRRISFCNCQKWDSVHGRTVCPHYQDLTGSFGQACFGGGAKIKCGFKDGREFPSA